MVYCVHCTSSGAQSAASVHSPSSISSSANGARGIPPSVDSRTQSRAASTSPHSKRQSLSTKMLSGWGQKMDAAQFVARKQTGPSLSRKASAVSSSNIFRPVHEVEDAFTVSHSSDGKRRPVFLLLFVCPLATDNLLENTDRVLRLPSVFSQRGSLLPSIYADARYIDAVIVSQARWSTHACKISFDARGTRVALAEHPQQRWRRPQRRA